MSPGSCPALQKAMENEKQSKEYKTHEFLIAGTKGAYKAMVLENTRSVMTSCTCGGQQKCGHILQILAGVDVNIKPESQGALPELQARLDSTPEGAKIIEKAKTMMMVSTRCPACASTNITALSKAHRMLAGMLYNDRPQSYRCRDCKVQW
ncbi:MAG: hypothetical protein EOP49_03855 [Sphingobacteriales bacterium]|nr:MAG: hypothetical protein EOP49_03855 [Sphingobacteriales bacterium]